MNRSNFKFVELVDVWGCKDASEDAKPYTGNLEVIGAQSRSRNVESMFGENNGSKD